MYFYLEGRGLVSVWKGVMAGTYGYSHIQRSRYQGTRECRWGRLINGNYGVCFLVVRGSCCDLEDVVMCHFAFLPLSSLNPSFVCCFVFQILLEVDLENC